MKKIIFILAFVMVSASFVCKVEATERRVATNAVNGAVKQEAQNPEDKIQQEMRKIDELIEVAQQKGDFKAIEKLEKKRREVFEKMMHQNDPAYEMMKIDEQIQQRLQKGEPVEDLENQRREIEKQLLKQQ